MDKNCNNNHGHCCGEHAEESPKWIYMGISALLLAAGMILKFVIGGFSESIWCVIIFVAAYILVGFPVLKEAFEEMRKGDFFNEFTLMSIASIGAFCIGEYPEAVAVMLFYSIGEALQDRAVDRAKDNIKSLLDVRPETATVVDGDRQRQIHPSEVAIGTEIEVKTGERIPLDGVLLSEKAAFNTAALTGESVPRTIGKNEEVLAGMIADDSTVRIRTTKSFSDSALSRILKMVEDASDRKAPAELFIRKFARIYTPIVIILAFLIPLCLIVLSHFGIIGMTAYDAIYRGLIFLVVSCPCALVVSVPLSYFAGIGAASRRAILFKGGNYLAAITKIDMVVFDKTGTLTNGKFAVKSIETNGETDKSQLVALAAAIESGSNHPIAKAIADYCTANGIATDRSDISTISEEAGYGLKASMGDSTVLLGNMKMLRKYGIPNIPDFSATAATIVGCTIDGKYIGALLLADTPKSDAKEAIADLKRQGITQTAILSGDKKEIVAELAAELGVTHFAGDLLPDGKVQEFEKLKANHTCAFVGDGINDAPVLALSDIGIAMGQLGSDAAIETADVVIQNDSPAKVAEAVKIGRTTEKIVKQNISMALIVKILILILGSFGLAELWEAVFADVGVAMLAILNALRIQPIINKRDNEQ